MRIPSSMAIAASVTALVTMAIDAPTATAQTEAPCGPIAYSIEHQNYVRLPCTAEAPKTESGKSASCGSIAYSLEDQNHVRMPCPLPTPRVEADRPAP